MPKPERERVIEQFYQLSHAAVMLEEAGLERTARVIRAHLDMRMMAFEHRLLTDNDIIGGDR